MKDSALKRMLVTIYEIFYEQRRMFVLRAKYRIHVRNSANTINYIIKNNCSISRFGDGEFKLMLNTADIGFQSRNQQLAERLLEVLKEKNKSFLICVPSTFNSVRGCNDFARRFWIEWGRMDNNQINVVNLLREYCGKNYHFGDTEMTRTYIDWKTDTRAKRLFPLLKKLWDKKDILFVEGDQTRLGVGNDLFDNANTISRVLAPAKNAFDKYDEILREVKKHAENKLIIIALGPTATVLAHDLCLEGYRALDIGHVDIEYEWYLRGVKERIAIPGKYTNEAKKGNGQDVSNCEDEIYLSQILSKIK